MANFHDFTQFGRLKSIRSLQPWTQYEQKSKKCLSAYFQKSRFTRIVWDRCDSRASVCTHLEATRRANDRMELQKLTFYISFHGSGISQVFSEALRGLWGLSGNSPGAFCGLSGVLRVVRGDRYIHVWKLLDMLRATYWDWNFFVSNWNRGFDTK